MLVLSLIGTACAQDLTLPAAVSAVAGASPAVAVAVALIVGAYKVGSVSQAWADVAKEGVLVRHRVELVLSPEDRALLEHALTSRRRPAA